MGGGLICTTFFRTVTLAENETCLPVCVYIYRGADKSLARPTYRCILFDGENISFDASLVLYINSTNIPPFMIINRIYENQNLLSHRRMVGCHRRFGTAYRSHLETLCSPSTGVLISS